MDGGAWWATVYGVAKSWTWLSDFTFTLHFHALEKEMATHSSTLAWKIPWTEEPGGLQSMGSQRVRHDWATSLYSLFSGTIDWFQIGKGLRQGCLSSPCLFNLHAEYIMRNAGLEETQAGIKIAGRNINNLRYADDTTLMMKVKEESEKVGLKLNI